MIRSTRAHVHIRTDLDWGVALVYIIFFTLLAALAAFWVWTTSVALRNTADAGAHHDLLTVQDAAYSELGQYLSDEGLVAEGFLDDATFRAVTNTDGSCYVAAIQSIDGHSNTWLVNSRSADMINVDDVRPSFYSWCVPSIDALVGGSAR